MVKDNNTKEYLLKIIDFYSIEINYCDLIYGKLIHSNELNFYQAYGGTTIELKINNVLIFTFKSYYDDNILILDKVETFSNYDDFKNENNSSQLILIFNNNKTRFLTYLTKKYINNSIFDQSSCHWLK